MNEILNSDSRHKSIVPKEKFKKFPPPVPDIYPLSRSCTLARAPLFGPRNMSSQVTISQWTARPALARPHLVLILRACPGVIRPEGLLGDRRNSHATCCISRVRYLETRCRQKDLALAGRTMPKVSIRPEHVTWRRARTTTAQGGM